MINGKVADCKDDFHIFMLNSTAYVGMKRAAEALAAIGDDKAPAVAAEALDFLKDIRASLDNAFAESPAVPLGNGTWCPSMPVWSENPGPICLQTTGGEWFSHGTVLCRDSLVSTQYLVLDEVITPDHVFSDHIVNFLADIYFTHNTCFSQPYYSPHPYINLRRGEVKAFLKEFYTNMSSLADKETYDFWEHYFHASPHKTHEEAWFLMRCRWMLYLEEDNGLFSLLPGVPRQWLEDGKNILVEGAASYFGKIYLQVTSAVSTGSIHVCLRVEGEPGRLPERLAVRVPHPLGMRAVSVTCGQYLAEKETVIFDCFNGEIDLTLYY
jgi:hypothetical protein